MKEIIIRARQRIMKQKIGGKIALLGAVVALVSIIVAAWRSDILFGIALAGIFTGAIGLGIMCTESNSNK